MGRDWEESARRALLTLADLTPSAAATRAPTAIPVEWFRWLPVNAFRLFLPTWDTSKLAAAQRMFVTEDELEGALAHLPVPVEAKFGERLAAIDQVRTEGHSVRVGWLFVAGQFTAENGRTQRVFQPLLSRPVRVLRALWGSSEARLVPAGDVEVNPLITDDTIRFQLEARFEFGGGALDGEEHITVSPALLESLAALRTYAATGMVGLGFPMAPVVPADRGPQEFMRSDHLSVVAGTGVYVSSAAEPLTSQASLRGWANRGLKAWTAFHSLYVEGEPPEIERDSRVEAEVAGTGIKPVSPFVLTPAQRWAVITSRDAPVTVVAGAPGTGKSHTITAIACDALARGETVLVAAKSEATVDALTALFERAPGPQPVVFGSNERKDALAAQLAAGQIQPAEDSARRAAREELERTVAARDTVYADIASRLRAEQSLESGADDVVLARVAFPALFTLDTDLDHVGSLIDIASHTGGGWLSRRRRQRATDELDEFSGAGTDAQRRDFVHAYLVARDARAAQVLVAGGGLALDAEWQALLRVDAEVRDRTARWLALEGRSDDRLTRGTLAAVAALGTALRSGRATRREQLARLDDKVTRALPLWVGTLSDIEDLLPRVARLFDLVVLDEASSIDQPLAAAALLRAQRAVIVGDPRQLRHVSFLSDEQRAKALRDNGVAEDSALALKLDVRRNSAFDLAAGVAPVLTLDEHFRCSPHLVDFVARRLYDGAVEVATRAPDTQGLDCVDLVRVDGTRDRGGVVHAEIDDLLARLRTLQEAPGGSVGVVTPFRAQADAIEAAVLGAFDAEQIERMDLRIGTVHAFQGNERDTIFLSLGVGADGAAGSWRFAQDPHLLAVLLTRARRHLVVITAADAPEGGLLDAYLRQADAPPGAPAPRADDGDDPWTDGIGRSLVDAGIPVFRDYPAGRHGVDLCVGDARGFFGVICAVHPEGPHAHIERHLSLRRAGWELREAFPSRWAERRGELVVELTGALGR